ncbi:MAG: hypothetical protein KAJ60_04165 [Desulfobulbaceae bacterium]|nr:hypothetical protein [Desulfobulbaceae bacterium]
MKLRVNKLISWAMAATFAEAGEWDTARKMIPEHEPNRKTSWFFRNFSAVAFAEEGMHDEARQMVAGERKHFLDDLAGLGLGKVHLRYGTVCVD